MPLQIDVQEALSKSGWLPVIASVRGDLDNSVTRGNRYLRLVDYVEGNGQKPTTGVGQYLGEEGFVETQAQATNVAQFTGEEIQRYLRDVGLTVNELPIVTVDDAGCVLGVIDPDNDGNYEWGAIKNIRSTLRSTRDAAVENMIGDSLLLPDPRPNVDSTDGEVVSVYNSGDAAWEVRHIRDLVEQALNVRLRMSNVTPTSDDDGRVMRVVDGRWGIAELPGGTISGYTIEVVDSLPSNTDPNTIYLVRGTT